MEIIITMAGISFASCVAEKVLMKLGKCDEAQMLSTVSLSSLAVSTIGGVVTLLSSLRKIK